MTSGYLTAADLTDEQIEREIVVKRRWLARAMKEAETASDQIADLEGEEARRREKAAR